MIAMPCLRITPWAGMPPGGNAKTSDVSGVDSAQRDANVKPITAED